MTPISGLLRFTDRGRDRNIKKCLICKETTSERKPFCIDHIQESDYVSNLLKKIKLRDQEIQSVKKYGKSAITSNSILSKDIIAHILDTGAQSVGRIAHAFHLSEEIINSYCGWLVEHGYIEIIPNVRSWRPPKVDIIC